MEFEGLLVLGFLSCVAIFAINLLVITAHWFFFFTVGLLSPVIIFWGLKLLILAPDSGGKSFNSLLLVYLVLLLLTVTVMLFERLLFGNSHILPWKVNSGSDRAINVSAKINFLFSEFLRLLSKPIILFFSPILKPSLKRVRSLIPVAENIIDVSAGYLERYVPITLSKIFLGVLLFTYIMSIYRWFERTHVSFWTGIKELFWALIPYLNITYVWDLWWVIIIFVTKFWTGVF